MNQRESHRKQIYIKKMILGGFDETTKCYIVPGNLTTKNQEPNCQEFIRHGNKLYQIAIINIAY